MEILAVKGVTKSFGGIEANVDISFHLNKGEILSLIGPNGAGKTTLFNCITGVFPLDKGTVWFNGSYIHDLSSNSICRLGLARTFQIPRTFLSMTVQENVITGSLLRTNNMKEAIRNSLEILEFVGLDKVATSQSAKLSVADRKRLEIARVLATKPKLIMLDEAMAGLNVEEQEEAIELVYKINNLGITVMLIEHVMNIVMKLSNRIIVFDRGRLIIEGKPEEISRDERVIKAYLGDDWNV